MASYHADGRHPVILAVEDLHAGYKRSAVVYDVSLTVRAGEIVTILGHDGAGKTTTMKTVFGLLRPMRGEVTYRGENVSTASCARHVAMGMS